MDVPAEMNRAADGREEMHKVDGIEQRVPSVVKHDIYAESRQVRGIGEKLPFTPPRYVEGPRVSLKEYAHCESFGHVGPRRAAARRQHWSSARRADARAPQRGA